MLGAYDFLLRVAVAFLAAVAVPLWPALVALTATAFTVVSSILTGPSGASRTVILLGVCGFGGSRSEAEGIRHLDVVEVGVPLQLRR